METRYFKKNGIHKELENLPELTQEEKELFIEAKKNKQFYYQARFHFNDDLTHPKHNNYRWK